MLVVLVYVDVKPDQVEAFQRATAENARESMLEPGVARFDVIRDAEQPSQFVLIEAYRDDAAPPAHKATAHYARWKAAVEPMMASPRRSVRYSNVFPADAAF